MAQGRVSLRPTIVCLLGFLLVPEGRLAGQIFDETATVRIYNRADTSIYVGIFTQKIGDVCGGGDDEMGGFRISPGGSFVYGDDTAEECNINTQPPPLFPEVPATQILFFHDQQAFLTYKLTEALKELVSVSLGKIPKVGWLAKFAWKQANGHLPSAQLIPGFWGGVEYPEDSGHYAVFWGKEWLAQAGREPVPRRPPAQPLLAAWQQVVAATAGKISAVEECMSSCVDIHEDCTGACGAIGDGCRGPCAAAEDLCTGLCRATASACRTVCVSAGTTCRRGCAALPALLRAGCIEACNATQSACVAPCDAAEAPCIDGCEAASSLCSRTCDVAEEGCNAACDFEDFLCMNVCELLPPVPQLEGDAIYTAESGGIYRTDPVGDRTRIVPGDWTGSRYLWYSAFYGEHGRIYTLGIEGRIHEHDVKNRTTRRFSNVLDEGLWRETLAGVLVVPPARVSEILGASPTSFIIPQLLLANANGRLYWVHLETGNTAAVDTAADFSTVDSFFSAGLTSFYWIDSSDGMLHKGTMTIDGFDTSGPFEGPDAGGMWTTLLDAVFDSPLLFTAHADGAGSLRRTIPRLGPNLPFGTIREGFGGTRFIFLSGDSLYILTSGGELYQVAKLTGEKVSIPGGGDLPEPPAPTRQRPGDMNQDGTIDIVDPVNLLTFLFLGTPQSLPCGDGTAEDPANHTLLGWTGNTSIGLSDGIAQLNWLFVGGPPHVLGTECQPIAGCPEVCDSQ